MKKFSVAVCAILGIGIGVGRAPAQGIGGSYWPGYYTGYYPFGSSWTNRYDVDEAAQRSASTQAAVNQSVAAARSAEAQRRARAAAGMQEAEARRWAALQSREDEDRSHDRLARLEARHLTAEREDIAKEVTGAWKQFALAAGGGKSLPTDFGGFIHVADNPSSSSAPITRAISSGVQAARGADVRANFRQPFLFTTQWFQDHPGSWMPEKWASTGDPPNSSATVWRYANWAGLLKWLGWNSKPISFDYGINIKIQYGIVFRDEAKEATEEDYYGQAVELAQTKSAAQPGADGWLPLGVFALVQEGQTEPSAVTHLAISKSGIIRGNYYNAATKTDYPLRGAVDKKTQRVAGIPGDQKEIVFELGLYNLTLDVTPVLVFSGKDKTEQWLMVRLKSPEAAQPIEPVRQEPQAAPEGHDKAFLEILVPADAEVWFDGYKSKQTGSVRKFSTPPLKQGEPYAYDVRVRWTMNGSPVEETRTVVVRAGERTRVEFPAPGS
jgi:uncharacterized protein (TIGR03000 family)